ncbi:MFS transporter, partial [Priestia megaterium]
MKDKITLFCLLSTVLLGVMNSFFFHIAVVPISKDLNISIAFSSWFILGYTIMVTIGSIVYSKLAESIQLKKLYLIALVIFVLFSILGYFMNNFYFLILCRLAQGAGGAAFISLTMVAVMDVLDRALLPIGLAFISFAMALGSGLGPLLSGILLSVTNWHILYLFMSCAIIFIPILYLTFPEMKLEKKTPFDWLGMFYLLISILFLLCALNINFLFIVLCIIFFLLFIRHISTISYPIINKKIFNNSSFVRITSLSFLLFLLLGANVFLLSYIFSSILNINSV